LFSTTSSVPDGSSSIDVGSRNATGCRAAGRTWIEPSREEELPARAVRVQRPAAGKTRRARYDPRLPVARAEIRPGPVAVTRTAPAYEAGRTVSLIVNARPATGDEGPAARDTRTGAAADALPTTVTRTAPSAMSRMSFRRRTG
jgi:hypothetical protein